MFKKLLSLFSSKEHNDFETSLWDNFTYKVMHDLKYARSPLTIELETDNEQYTSHILKLDPEKELMVLDELFPQEGNLKVHNGQKLYIECSNRGVKVSFECVVSKWIKNHGLSGVLVHFPEKVDYEQKRDSFRAEVPEGHDYRGQFRLLDTPTFYGKLNDISLSGMRLTVPQNIAQYVQIDQMIEQAKIILPNQETISAPFLVRHMRYRPQNKGTVLGCEFSQIALEDQQKINRCVADLQRLASEGPSS